MKTVDVDKLFEDENNNQFFETHYHRNKTDDAVSSQNKVHLLNARFCAVLAVSILFYRHILKQKLEIDVENGATELTSNESSSPTYVKLTEY
jgi:hypothetical protein